MRIIFCNSTYQERRLKEATCLLREKIRNPAFFLSFRFPYPRESSSLTLELYLPRSSFSLISSLLCPSQTFLSDVSAPGGRALSYVDHDTWAAWAPLTLSGFCACEGPYRYPLVRKCWPMDNRHVGKAVRMTVGSFGTSGLGREAML